MNAVCGVAEANGINVGHGSIAALGAGTESGRWSVGREANDQRL